MFSAHTTPEEFVNGVFTLKTHQMFSVLTTPEKLMWTVGVTGEIKLRFRDGLAWTGGLTGEIKLRFQISPA